MPQQALSRSGNRAAWPPVTWRDCSDSLPRFKRTSLLSGSAIAMTKPTSAPAVCMPRAGQTSEVNQTYSCCYCCCCCYYAIAATTVNATATATVTAIVIRHPAITMACYKSLQIQFSSIRVCLKSPTTNRAPLASRKQEAISAKLGRFSRLCYGTLKIAMTPTPYRPGG